MPSNPPTQAPQEQEQVLASFANFDRRIRLAFGAVMLALVVGAVYSRNVAEREQAELSTLVSQILAKSINRISFSGKYHARLLLEEMVRSQAGIRYIALADKDGQILAHSDPRLNDGRLDEASLAAARLVLGGQPEEVREVRVNGELIREVTVAYVSGFDEKVSGVIQVGLSRQAQAAALVEGLLFRGGLTLLLLAVGAGVTRVISKRFARPVVQLANDMAATLQAIPDLLFELDLQGRYLKVVTRNPEKLLASRGQLLGKTVSQVMPVKGAQTVLQSLARAHERGSDYGAEITLPLPEGERVFELSVARKPGADAQDPRFIVLSRDITERKRAVDEINTLAFYDPLTSLPNRRLLLDRLQQAIAGLGRSQQHGALLLIDLDHFKLLNDDRGHAMGDELLKQVAARLGSSVREGDTVARLGGDEFVVVLQDLNVSLQSAATQAETVARNILGAMQQAYPIGSGQHHSTASVGVALFGADPGSPHDLLKRAEMAMYQSKAAGRNTLSFYDPEMQAVVSARAALEADLRLALPRGECQVHYQVQVDAHAQPTGVEALLRWRHPQRGMVPPMSFIGLAEDTGLIRELGHWVLLTACEQLVAWADDPRTSGLSIAVNVSAVQLNAAEFVQEVAQVLASTGARADLLKLELTESLLVKDVERTIVKMQALKALGVGFSLDDFGTGYSSLSYLKRLPLNQLKIDQSFVRQILHDENDAAIAHMVVALAQSLGLSVIAEGVETAAQRDCLASQGCYAYQGYFFGRPMPVAQLEAEILHKNTI
jgi:diguanylate cyclase (GGDEF)-like protein